MDDSRNPTRLKGAIRALSHPHFRIYFFGMLISFTGTWMQGVAQSWLVYKLTRSAWLLGLVGFVSQMPLFLLTPLGGVMADRHSRHRIVLATQAASMVQASALAALTLSGKVTFEAILVLALLLGLVNAFDMPARQAMMGELVSSEDLTNAIALNSSAINMARLAGPALAGFFVDWFGEGVCFLLNALSYLIVIIGLLSIRAGDPPSRDRSSALRSFREGLDYVLGSGPIRSVLALVALVSLFGLSYMVLMPIFASKVLNGGPRALGTLMSSAGVGSLAAALWLAARPSAVGLGSIVGKAAAAAGLLLIAFSQSRNLLLSTALMIPIGFSLMMQMAGSNTLLQSLVPDRMRGRIISFYSMSLMGMTPFGSLLAGALAARIGAPNTVALGGTVCLAAALAFLLKLPKLEGQLKAEPDLSEQPPY